MPGRSPCTPPGLRPGPGGLRPAPARGEAPPGPGYSLRGQQRYFSESSQESPETRKAAFPDCFILEIIVSGAGPG